MRYVLAVLLVACGSPMSTPDAGTDAGDSGVDAGACDGGTACGVRAHMELTYTYAPQTGTICAVRTTCTAAIELDLGDAGRIAANLRGFNTFCEQRDDIPETATTPHIYRFNCEAACWGTNSFSNGCCGVYPDGTSPNECHWTPP